MRGPALVGTIVEEDDILPVLTRWPGIAIDRDPSSSPAQGLLGLLGLLGKTSEREFAAAHYCSTLELEGVASSSNRVVAAPADVLAAEGQDRAGGLAAAGKTEPEGTEHVGPRTRNAVRDSARLPWDHRRDGFEGTSDPHSLRAGLSEEVAAACQTCPTTSSGFVHPSGAAGQRRSEFETGREAARRQRCWRRRHLAGSWMNGRTGSTSAEAYDLDGSRPCLLHTSPGEIMLSTTSSSYFKAPTRTNGAGAAATESGGMML